MPDPAKPVGLILGAAVWPGGQPSPALRRRALRGAQLWHNGHVSALLACGGIGKHGPSEAEVTRDLCLEAGVPRHVLHMEARSTTTEENLRFALPILRRLQAGDVVVVSDFYHLPRARLVARRQGLQATGAAPPLRGANPVFTAKAIGREIPAYLYYWLSGKGR